MEFALVLPESFNASTLHGVWAAFSKLNAAKSDRPSVHFDASCVAYCDVEGANYMLLLPQLLADGGWNIAVSLPKNSKAFDFLATLGVIGQLTSRFPLMKETHLADTIARSRKMEPYLSQAADYFDRARAFGTYLIDRQTLPRVLRAERIQEHMFALDPGVARRVCVCLFELVVNIFEHSGETVGCLTIQYRKITRSKKRDDIPRDRRAGQLFCAVADLGVGIPATLRHAWTAEFGEQGKPEDLLRWATQPGCSRYGREALRGHGLSIVRRDASILRIASGNAALRIDKGETERTTVQKNAIPGTNIVATYDVFGAAETEIVIRSLPNYSRGSPSPVHRV